MNSQSFWPFERLTGSAMAMQYQQAEMLTVFYHFP
jgi:hypothetical protein